MRQKIEAPVLLIGFNRPYATKMAFNAIREIKPPKLYVAIDGPRSNRQEDAELCRHVIDVTKNVDWQCDAKYLIREENLGCKNGVSGAITWALQNEEKIIVIEDDIVAVPAFFYFADELLERFKNDDRIAMISANQYSPVDVNYDYLFTKYGHIWGWATWKRVWNKFDLNVPDLEDAVNKGLPSMSFGSRSESEYHKQYFLAWVTKIKNNRENAWGPQFLFFRLQNGLLSIAPKVNLASNIGNVSSRTNIVSRNNDNFYPAIDNFNLVNHPVDIECDLNYDSYHFKTHLNRKAPFFRRIFRKAAEIIRQF